MSKRKNGEVEAAVHDIIQYASSADNETDVKAYFNDLRAVSKDATKLLKERNDKAVGAAVGLMIFALLQSLQYLPEYARLTLAQNGDLFLGVGLFSFMVMIIDGIVLAKNLSDLHKPLEKMRALCELLGIPNAPVSTVLHEVKLAETHIHAKLANGATATRSRKRIEPLPKNLHDLVSSPDRLNVNEKQDDEVAPAWTDAPISGSVLPRKDTK